jgi:hypothetical protein
MNEDKLAARVDSVPCAARARATDRSTVVPEPLAG